MSTRNINEVLTSGEISNIVVGENITYQLASDPAYENMFLRIGPGGQTTLYKAPDQDIVWTDTDATNISLTTTLVDVLSITPTEDLESSDTSYRISGSLDNTTNQIAIVTITVKVDTVVYRTEDIQLSGSEVGKAFLLNGIVATTIPTASVIDVAFSSNSDNNVLLRGDISATTFTVTKAQAAPVLALVAEDLEVQDYKLVLTTAINLGPRLSRVDIETVITDSGYLFPTDSVTFSIADNNNHRYLTRYNATIDEYSYISADKAL